MIFLRSYLHLWSSEVVVMMSQEENLLDLPQIGFVQHFWF